MLNVMMFVCSSPVVLNKVHLLLPFFLDHFLLQVLIYHGCYVTDGKCQLNSCWMTQVDLSLSLFVNKLIPLFFFLINTVST